MTESLPDPIKPDGRKRTIRLITQTKIAACLGLAVMVPGLIIGAMLPRDANIVVMIVSGCLGGTGLFIAFFMWLFSLSWQRAVNRMVAGDYYVYWTYEPQQWQDHVTAEHRSSRWVPWVVGGCISVVGILIAILTVSDGHAIGGSAVLSWLVWAGSFTLIGAALGMIFHLLGRRRYERLMRETGDVFIGPKGFYISGDYWPWSTLGQRLESFNAEPGPPMCIVFVFRIQQKYGSTTKGVRVPVPLGRESEWEGVMEKLSSE